LSLKSLKLKASGGLPEQILHMYPSQPEAQHREITNNWHKNLPTLEPKPNQQNTITFSEGPRALITCERK